MSKEETMSSRFEQFLREREYLLGVSPNTIEWHRQSLQWLRIEEPTAEDLKELVLRMRAAGLKPSSVNCRLRSINAYLHWNSGASTDRKCGAGCQHPHVPRVKEPVLVLPTFSLEDIHKLRAYKPKDYCQQRLQTLALMLADTGCRITELLSLQWKDVDFDNLLVTVPCKGDKQRVIPFSFEMRKFLYRLKQNFTKLGDSPLVFPTRTQNTQLRGNVLRDIKLLCRELSINIPRRALHAFRHSMATTYIKRGGL